MSSFLGQTSGMAAGTLASRLTGVIRDIALVAAIGTGIFSDTYSVANSIPNIIYILIAGGAINSVFIPALIRHMEDDADQGKQFTDQLHRGVQRSRDGKWHASADIGNRNNR